MFLGEIVQDQGTQSCFSAQYATYQIGLHIRVHHVHITYAAAQFSYWGLGILVQIRLFYHLSYISFYFTQTHTQPNVQSLKGKVHYNLPSKRPVTARYNPHKCTLLVVIKRQFTLLNTYEQASIYLHFTAKHLTF